MPYKDPEVAAAFHKAYKEKRKNNAALREKDAEARRKSYRKQADFRQGLLGEFGCLLCPIEDPDLIDWHHVNPEEKEYEIKNFKIPHDIWWNEVLKCIPVCCNCHRKIHTNKLCLISPTGYKPQQDTESTSVRDCIFPQSPPS